VPVVPINTSRSIGAALLLIGGSGFRPEASPGGAASAGLPLRDTDRPDPGGIAGRTEKMLTESQWRALSAALARVRFWSMPTRQAKRLGSDGSQWIIEGFHPDNQYHVVDRWSPDAGPYRDAGLLFLTLAGISVPDHERY
jgi:hypothetical protein